MRAQHSNPLTVKPAEIVEKFFSGKREELLKVLVGVDGESLLEKFAKSLGGKREREKLSFTKVRKYYEQFLNIYEEALGRVLEGKALKQDSLPEEILVKLYLLKSHVVYDQAREGGKVREDKFKNPKAQKFENFKEFVNSLILKINTYDELEKAKRLFEAFVGYAKLYLGS